MHKGPIVRVLIVTALLALPVASSAAKPTPLFYPFHPSFPLFEGGKFTNIADSDETLALGAAHAGWSLAVPLLGEKVGGRKGLWIAGLSWLGVSLIHQSFFQTPPDRPPNYQPGPEFRTDLITKLAPCLILLAVDLARHGW